MSSKEIEDITKSLKIKNSHGYDGITTKILKLNMHYISSPLTYTCNRMLNFGIFPTRQVQPNRVPCEILKLGGESMTPLLATLLEISLKMLLSQVNGRKQVLPI